jgi:uncharacterized protein (DUF1800 family)
MLGFGQTEPCGFFEVDGVPGFNDLDLTYCTSWWLQDNIETDFDGDGMTSVLDMIALENCMGNLGHGLAGTYYGFDEGGEFEITYPDFSALSDPVVVRATESLNHAIYNWDNFLDSGMNENYAALFEGYLMVPADGVYDFQLSGYRGMNLYIDSQHVTGFTDGWVDPVEGSMSLTYGLHPIRVEFFTGDHPGSMLLKWRPSGSPVFTVISAQDFYHTASAVPTYANTGLECLFEPASGGRTFSTTLELKAYFMGPDTDLHVTYLGQELVLKDGLWNEVLALEPGLNTMEFNVTDGEGREKTITYHIYCDRENPTSSGLVARLYAEIYDTAPIPEVDDLVPIEQVPVSGPQLTGTSIGGVFVASGVLCHLEGTIHITQAGRYRFRITNVGSLRINGIAIASIHGEYRNQWKEWGYVNLEAGNHHFHLHTGSPWRGPEMAVYWTVGENEEELIPNSVFHYSGNDFLPPPETDPPVINGRVRDGLIAEYLLREGEALKDSSGNRFTLEDEMSAHKLSPGGVQLTQEGGFQSEQAGVHTAHQLVKNHAASFEVEFIWQGEVPDDWQLKPLFYLLPPGGYYMAGIVTQYDQLYFAVRDQDDWELNGYVGMDEFLTIYQNQRVHVVGTMDGNSLKLYVNGQLVNTEVSTARVDEWSSTYLLAMGNPSTYWNWGEPDTPDNHFNGKIIMAATYGKALSSAEVLTNYQANQTLFSTPADPVFTRQPFPPAGTTTAQLEEAHHVLNRLSFGPTQESLEDILQSGVDAWILNQMDPDNIDDTALENFLSKIHLKQATSESGFAEEMLIRATYSRKQLNEVLTQFWENHFNTELRKVDYPEEEWRENHAFRANALGNFKDLLLASGMGYPMNVYLDNIYNTVGAPNENYAREILELHTFGANNGYTQEDIVQGARCFTGWSIKHGEFTFRPGLHDYGAKYIPSLDLTIPAGGGLIDGMLLIDAIINDPHCADFIAWKLCQLLVDDDPPADVLSAASSAFTASGGEISAVISAIVNHPRFRIDPAYRRNKVKTPLEFILSAVRVTESYPRFHAMYYYLDKMGMALFNYPFPTGFEETGQFWINTNSLLYRWNFIHEITSNRGNSDSPGINMDLFVNSRNLTTSNEVMNLFEGLTTHGTQEGTVNTTLENYLTNGDPGNFQVTPQTVDQEIRHTLSLFLRLPEYNKQ